MPTGRHASYRVLYALLIFIIGIEVILQAADQGWVGSRGWRVLALQFGAFWPDLLGTWDPNYPGQPIVMFVSYAFLHAGIGHLLRNAISLWSLGSIVCDRVGARNFSFILLLTTLGGAVCFAVLTTGSAPMIGASGAVFGLAGVWLRWQWQAKSAGIIGILRVSAIIGLLIALNLALFAWNEGGLAWQTHLGGSMVEWLCGGFWSETKMNR